VSRAQSVPVLAPVKHREAGTVVGHLVVHPTLHPDHEVSPERAQALRLVTADQIARAFGVSVSTVLRWHQESAHFPKRRAWLAVDGSPGRSHLYDRAEIIAWVEQHRPKYARRARS